jgi:hypothetical protein
VTNWGYLLLALYVALGLTSRLTARRATRWAVGATVLVAVFVFANYHALR